MAKFFAATRVNSPRCDPFQAKFRRVMAGFGKSVTTANAKGETSNLLIDIVAFLEY